jgi:ribosomal protein S8
MITVPERSLFNSMDGMKALLRSTTYADSYRLNKTGCISPRFNIQLKDLEKWVVKLLPSRQFGFIVLTTSAGIMDHEEARRKHVAGKILGFFY